jgi:nicotinamidase-related amidase
MNHTGPEPQPLPNTQEKVIRGAEAIAEYIFGDRTSRRKVYYLAEKARIPIFRLGSTLRLRPPACERFIAGQKARARSQVVVPPILAWRVSPALFCVSHDDEADRERRSSLRRHEAHFRQRRRLGNAVDGASASDHRRHRLVLRRADGVLSLHHADLAGAGGRPMAAYFERWRRATREMLEVSQLDLIPPLARLVPPATIIDKSTYSAFFRSELAGWLRDRHVTTIVVTGAETDVCVLSTVLDAVNIGLGVVIVEDALCGSSDAGHDALMTMYRLRFTEQIDLIEANELRKMWRPD